MNKTCSQCKRNLSQDAFNKNKTEKDGLQRHCKDCRKAHYQINRSAIIAKVSAHNKKRKVEKSLYDKIRRELKKDQLKEYERNRSSLPKRRELVLKWAKQNPEKRKEISKKSFKKHWPETYKRNKHLYLIAASKRRAILTNAQPKWFSELDYFVLQESALLVDLREKFTGIKWEIDHIIPLKHKFACGLHSAHNIQVIPMAFNRSKGAKNMQEYSCGYGFL